MLVKINIASKYFLNYHKKMINIDFLTLKAFFLENIDFLIGARLQKIRQPDRRDLILSLRNNSESKKLYININPEIYHICFINDETEKLRNIQYPKHPPMFCMLLRKYLENARINDACVIENERILELHFEIMDEFSTKRSLCLAFELMGKYSNIILYDKNDFKIIGSAHNVGAEKSRIREIRGGVKYIYPQINNTLPFILKEQFKELSQEKINFYLNKESFSPAFYDDKYTLFSELITDSLKQDSINSMLDKYYAKYQNLKNINTFKNKLNKIIFTKEKRINNSLKNIEIILKKEKNISYYKLCGEILTANLYKNILHSNEIELWDYINNKNITIELNSNMTMSENAQRYYKLYNKLKTAQEKNSELLNTLTREKEYLASIRYSIDIASSIDELNEVAQELSIDLYDKNIKTDKEKILKENIDGFTIYIGKNNKQNDYIISKLAKDDDYWFHTKLCPGSHILLKISETEPNENIIYECAKLARKYSSAQLPSKVSVIYTKRKHLKKPPKAPLGYVTYKNEKEILI